MPRALLAPLLALGCTALLSGAPRTVSAATAQVTLEVPRGKAQSVRLRHLPRGALISVSIRASARLVVVLKSARQLKAKSPDAVFRGALERRLSFRIRIPETDDYYLVLDNRRGAGAVKVTATVRAVRGKKQKPPPPPAPDQPKRDGKFEQTRAAGSAALA